MIWKRVYYTPIKYLLGLIRQVCIVCGIGRSVPRFLDTPAIIRHNIVQFVSSSPYRIKYIFVLVSIQTDGQMETAESSQFLKLIKNFPSLIILICPMASRYPIYVYIFLNNIINILKSRQRKRGRLSVKIYKKYIFPP